ncbi:RagB/SusD family nutrient uptake outer membrane protein [Aestuariibaculum suncheonense]|uniref:RagB/SusD family nutrient uptake outer membrane protein n=1 Tax=Aestuariibaculum suncheonense TaxID=1028745 RepID=A0A8J6QBV9_9FLAO|nr:RagB/SusD family nutrient uptake outer membrane protein [Aestuariibaculum suncheonense]MBD0834770.1 RagB/SusD family nutrient uptake outer membrane protein [Aestuariibaculum suncheonense]
MLRDIKLNETKIITCVLAILVSGYSCSELVDENPISEIGPANFYKNNSDLEAGVIAAYDGMQGTYSDKTFFWGEFRSDNFHPEGGSSSQTALEILNNDLTQSNPGSRWDRFYRMIDRANQVIANAPKIDNFNQNFLGEALAIRAKAYFDAVRVWGDVPLFIEPVQFLSDATKPATDANTIINEVILPDMIRAEELILTTEDNFRFSKSSVLALQAEVYMWLNEYAKAKAAIEQIIAFNEYSLVTTPVAWEELFHNTPIGSGIEGAKGKIQKGSELIMSIRYDIEEDRDYGGTRNNRSGIRGLFFAGIPSYFISPIVENKWREKFPVDSLGWVSKYPNTNPALTQILFEDDGMGGITEREVPVYGDWRYYFCREGRVQNFDSKEIGEARCAKWTLSNFSSNEDDTDIVLYRYADMLLLLAEAENYLDNNVRALELINEIRIARQLPTVSGTEFGATKEERLNYILDERQLELFGEGKRWWDLVRNDKAMEVLNPILEAREGGQPLTEPRLLWPIHVEHLTENTLLEQNTGYKF